MEAEKLRIGNLFQEQNTKEVIMVTELSQFKIGFSGSFKGEWQAKPIPLTEEWLLKLGKIEWVNKDIDGFFYWFNGEKKYLKFVHSLQNTYFYIEQKELLCDNI